MLKVLVRLGKIKCAAKALARVQVCSSFNFARRWHFVCRFNVCLMSVVSSVTLAPNVPRPCAVAEYGKLICPAKIKINAKRNAEF